MPSPCDISSSVKNTWFFAGLAASRWAPGGIEEQKMAHQVVDQQTTNQKVNGQKTNERKLNNQKTNNQKKSIQKTASDQASASTANGLASSRWAANPTETATKNVNTLKKGNQQVVKDEAHVPSVNGLTKSLWAASPAEATNQTVNKKKNKVDEAKHKTNQKKNPHGTPTNLPAPVAKTKATPRRIIGELSEEKAVKMENPFFDPEKHKGLASSRWAN
ncbi:hypothetical protein J7T55_006595 [Diaporthe amygdali]|uniref:uncharacterized protein n=1 Tax=Phomopsis amygdali TaxID=1214568 RepID=UPI0022FF0458|nr:uncharacterized protein J7T55_006595 [Diaporthe amygdali]KAJ0125250.1 hypothetical protein J7T55_006595 [Diaporthe amygdali]